MKLLNQITPIEENFSKWYQDVVIKGNMITYSSLQGLMIFKPIAYGIWENIQTEFNKIIKKKLYVKNVKLPLLIPFSMIKKESEHIKGFAPELAQITKVGNKVLDEPLVIRPTSEVLFTELFAKEVKSYQDLPLIFNQWANIFRWEKKTNPFLRNREFMWQEGHTAHSTSIAARKMTTTVIKIYAKFLKEYLAIPTIMGKKTISEKFAGAVTTYTVESMTKNGRALQSGTSHYLGQKFAKSYNAQFKGANNKKIFIYQTSWGMSTRVIGAIIMNHGDNRGIIIPPKIAFYKVDIIEILGNKNNKVREYAKKIHQILYPIYNSRIDMSNKSWGNKVSQSEIEGTPIRIEVGAREIVKNLVTIVRRDTLEKKLVKISDIKSKVQESLDAVQQNLFNRAKLRLEKNTITVLTYKDFLIHINNNKFVMAPFAGTTNDELKIKEETKATVRCILSKKNYKKLKCIFTNKLTTRLVIFAKSY